MTTQSHRVIIIVMALGIKVNQTVNLQLIKVLVKEKPHKKAVLHGGIAQLGARLTGSQKVRGSTPLISTRKSDLFRQVAFSMKFACSKRNSFAMKYTTGMKYCYAI